MRDRSDLLRKVGANVRALRQERGLTQEQVAERAGFTAKYVSEIERGQRDPPLGTIALIATRGLGCSLAEVVGPVLPTPTPKRDPGRPAQDLPPSLRKITERLAAMPSDELRSMVLKLLNDVLRFAETVGSEKKKPRG